MNQSVASIGRCKGCYKNCRLDDGVCKECLEHPKRGRKWAEMSHRCRTEPDYALAVYLKIKTPRGREMFIESYGLPPGAEQVNSPAIRLVQ